MKQMAKSILKKVVPDFWYYLYYRHSLQKLGDSRLDAAIMFEQMLQYGNDKACLQIGVKENMARKYGEHWISVDKYDMRPFIDRHDDINDLQFDNNTFDVAVCMSILEHVETPQRAVDELHRVLKPGGFVWVQSPLCYPYHESPKDFWRFTPDGLRWLCDDFDEVDCGAFAFDRSAFAVSSYFYGKKPNGVNL